MDIQQAEAKLQSLTWLVTAAAAFILVFVVSMTGLMLWQAARLGGTSAEIQNVAITTHDSLCALKEDIQRRHDAGVKYLADHPNQDPILGDVPRATIEKSVSDQQHTLDSLSGLDCDT